MARLAHDLQLRVAHFDGQLHIEQESERWSATLRIGVDDLLVEGVLRGRRLDTGGLSDRDRRLIASKIKRDVLPGAEVLVRVNGDDRHQGQGVVKVPRGQQRITFRLSQRADEALQGSVMLSLARLGIPPIKGPLGAFRVADEVEVLFVVAWT